MELLIRRAVREDLPFILRLYAQPGMDDGQVLALPEAGKIFDKMNTYPDYAVYVAEQDGCIAGTFALAILDNLAHMGAPSALVEDVVVAPALQGKGIGKQMMRFAMEVCKKKGCYKMALSSNLKREDAHGFYKRLGFKIHGYSFSTEL